MTQASVSAHRLAKTAPSLLSPTGRSLREEAVVWVEQHSYSEAAPSEEVEYEARELKVVPQTAKSIKGVQSQLPLLGSVPDC